MNDTAIRAPTHLQAVRTAVIASCLLLILGHRRPPLRGPRHPVEVFQDAAWLLGQGTLALAALIAMTHWLTPYRSDQRVLIWGGIGLAALWASIWLEY